MPFFDNRKAVPFSFRESLRNLFRRTDPTPQLPEGSVPLPCVVKRSYPAETAAGFTCTLELTGWVNWRAKTAPHVLVWATKAEINDVVDHYHRELLSIALQSACFGFGFANVQLPSKYTSPAIWQYRIRRHRKPIIGVQDPSGIKTCEVANRLTRRSRWSHNGMYIWVSSMEVEMLPDDLEANYARLTPKQIAMVDRMDPMAPHLSPLHAGGIDYLRTLQELTSFSSNRFLALQQAAEEAARPKLIKQSIDRLEIESTVQRNNHT